MDVDCLVSEVAVTSNRWSRRFVFLEMNILPVVSICNICTYIAV